MTYAVGHAPLAIDRLLDVRTTEWQKQLLTTMQCRSHSRRLTIECLFVTACSMDEYAKEKRTEKNLIVRSGIPEAETTIIKDCARRFVLKLYRHEASRGLFATAELLVLSSSAGCTDAAQCILRQARVVGGSTLVHGPCRSKNPFLSHPTSGEWAGCPLPKTSPRPRPL